MKMRNFISIALVAVFLPACIPSVHPYYTEKDVVFEPGMVEEWQVKDATHEEVWKFEKGNDKAYKLTMTQKEGKDGEFEAHLFKLKDDYFLDFILSKFDANVGEWSAASLIPGHLLIKVQQLAPELKLATFDFDWLDKHLKENPKALAHEREDHRIILTAGTADLQSFILKHSGEGELFAKSSEMILRKGKSSANEPAAEK